MDLVVDGTTSHSHAQDMGPQMVADNVWAVTSPVHRWHDRRKSYVPEAPLDLPLTAQQAGCSLERLWALIPDTHHIPCICLNAELDWQLARMNIHG